MKWILHILIHIDQFQTHIWKCIKHEWSICVILVKLNSQCSIPNPHLKVTQTWVRCMWCMKFCTFDADALKSKWEIFRSFHFASSFFIYWCWRININHIRQVAPSSCQQWKKLSDLYLYFSFPIQILCIPKLLRKEQGICMLIPNCNILMRKFVWLIIAFSSPSHYTYFSIRASKFHLRLGKR